MYNKMENISKTKQLANRTNHFCSLKKYFKGKKKHNKLLAQK